MSKIAVAVLHVDEGKPDPCGIARGVHEVVDQAIELLVADARCIVRDGEARVEHRMPVGNAWPWAGSGGAGVSAGVRELEPDDEIVGGPEMRDVGGHEVLPQRLEIRQRPLRDHELVRVCAPVVPHGDCFAAPDHFRAALPEPLPAASRQIGRIAVGRAVPALHRKDREAVAGAKAIRSQRLRQW